MQLLFLRHRGSSLSTGQDNALHFFRYGKLRTQSSSGSLERRDSRRDVIAHAVSIEEGHLFLDGSIDTRIACMKTDHEQSLVVELFHQGKLFLQIHVSRTAYHCPLLGIISQLTRHETACIQHQVGLFKHLLATHGNQFRVTRPGSYNFNVSSTYRICLQRHGKSEMRAWCQRTLLFLNQPFSASTALACRTFGHSIHTGHFIDLLRRVGNLHADQFFRRIDANLRLRPFILQSLQQRFVLLQRYCTDGGQ